jgi:DNA-directed RNA polymerase specialized sigma24 family protein
MAGAGRILADLARIAVRSLPRWALDREDAAQEVALRALERDCAALRRVHDPGTPLFVWLRSCARNHFREKEREKGKEMEGLGTRIEVEAVMDPRPGPEEAVSHGEDIRLDRDIVLMAVPDLSRSRGFVLYLQVLCGLTHAEIHEELARCVPVGRDRVDQLVREAHGEFQVWLAGKDPRRARPDDVDACQGPATPLPPPESPTMWRGCADAPEVGETRGCAPGPRRDREDDGTGPVPGVGPTVECPPGPSTA